MCGRYYFSIEEAPAFAKLKQKITQMSISHFAQHEIFPSQNALVLVEGQADYSLDVMKWGIKGFQNKLLINARNEGIETKKTFSPMLKHRCLIPCNGFYEWKNKKKVFIYEKEEPIFYLAGIYNEQKEFVIVTGEAEKDMKFVHHRTPIILHEKDIERYLKGDCEFAVDNDDLAFSLDDPAS